MAYIRGDVASIFLLNDQPTAAVSPFFLQNDQLWNIHLAKVLELWQSYLCIFIENNSLKPSFLKKIRAPNFKTTKRYFFW